MGTVSEIHHVAEVIDQEEGPTVLVRVDIQKEDIDDLRPGATVSARVQCGRRSVGYVMFHDLFGWFQREVLFRL